MDILNDTIAAVATPRGTGGIAVIRISGSDSFAVSDKVLRLKNRMSLHHLDPAKMYACTVSSERGVIDECLCTHFKAPHSYTGEDTVEIFCHGGALCTSLVLTEVLCAGARQALAGEFTRRAYVNGKLSLTAAEAVGELIHAKTYGGVLLSNSNIHGTLNADINSICDELRALLASVYVYIDYPDEELYDVSSDEMRQRLSSVKERIDRLARSYRSGMAISEGIETVIIGTPNTGKSTLLNLLCGCDRAIVTEIAGTTRDVISEEVALGDVLLRLSDTAGVRKTDDVVESIGIEKSFSALDSSQLVIAVFDGSRELSADDRELISRLKASQATVIAAVNKCDLGTVPKAELEKELSTVLTFSAKNGDAKHILEEKIKELFLDSELSLTASPIVTTAARHSSLLMAADCLSRAVTLLLSSDEQTIAGSLCEDALAYLEESSGRLVSEEIVNTIFSKFCVGK